VARAWGEEVEEEEDIKKHPVAVSVSLKEDWEGDAPLSTEQHNPHNHTGLTKLQKREQMHPFILALLQ